MWMYAAAGLGLLALAQLFLLWRLGRGLRVLGRVDARLAAFAEALTLLTDTTENGLRTLADQVAAAPRRERDADARSVAQTGRILRAALRGQPVHEIAAAEHLSEGEVRLHLHLTGGAAHATQGERYGALRLD